MSQKIIQNNEALEEMLKKLKLLDIRENYQDIVEEAIDAKLGYKDFLIKLVSMEVEGRKNRLGNRLIMQAGFDSIKTLEDIEYDFNKSINYQKIKELGTLEFIEKGENIIIIGPPGVGKSMIATGIGVNACKAGKKVIFSNAKELVDDLYEAMKLGNLKDELKRM